MSRKKPYNSGMSNAKTAEKRGRGQPKKPESEKRKPLMLRVNDAERKVIERRAKKAGLPVATYLRQRGTGEL